jgi:solute carrier family 35 protein F1/2
MGVLFASSGWKILLFGQALSFLLAAGGAAQATLHFQCSLSAPTFSSAFFYFLLSLHLIPLYRQGRRSRHIDSVVQNEPRWFCGIIPLYVSPWAYIGIAFLDVQANYMTVLAYRYTTITSITLFDALAIPSAMSLSYLFLGRRFTAIHFMGVLVCMSGVVFNVLADYESDSSSDEYPHKVWGDILAISGGIVYGANDVLAEMAVRRFGGPTEFVAMIGLFGTLISLVQAAVLERADIVEFFSPGSCSVWTGLGLLMAYAFTCFLSYVGASRFLAISEATFLSLSFLTGDFWSLGFSIIAERIVPSPLFYVALTLTLSGVVIYEIGPSTILDEIKYENVESNGEMELPSNHLSNNNII